MAFTIADTEKLLLAIARCVFGVSLAEHALAVGRRMYCCEVVEDDDRAPIEIQPLFGNPPDDIFVAIRRKGLPGGVASTAVDAGVPLGFAPSADLFFVTRRLFRDTDAEIVAILFHELCHFVVESNLAERYGVQDERAVRAALVACKYTLYSDPYTNNMKHSSDWFAVLCHMSHRLVACYPEYFSSQQHAVELALAYDRPDERMTDVPWYSV